MTNAKAKSLLANGAPLMLTLTPAGPLFSIDGQGAVAAKLARDLTQPDPTQSDLFLVPNDDGLFPGCHQTWQAR